MSDLTISVKAAIENGQLNFYPTFNRALTTVERDHLASVNLSRGGTRMYRLDNLSQHNSHGANWNDGASYHTDKDFTKYEMRVKTDIAKAWTASKEAIAKAMKPVVAKPNSGTFNFFTANGN